MNTLELQKLLTNMEECQACKGCVNFNIAHKSMYTDVNAYPDNGVLVVGEMPGKQEVNSGTPFIGPSGKIIKNILNKYDLSKHCAFTNVNICRPTNGKFSKDDVQFGGTYLIKLIDIMKPRVILTLGRVATNTVLGFRVSITKAVGSVYELNNGSFVVPCIHPAVAVRNGRYYNSSVFYLFHTLVMLAKSLYDDYEKLTSFNQNDTEHEVVFKDTSSVSLMDLL